MITQQYIDSNTPLGANLTAGGATFRVWGPGAQRVFLNGSLGGESHWQKDQDPSVLLSKDRAGYWAGFWPGAREGDTYKYFVVGSGSAGYKRDPFARELSVDPPFPHSNCILRAPDAYSWHDSTFVTPDFSDMVIYQAHVGTFYSKVPGEPGTFLDVVEKIEYLAALGINVLQLLPIDEFETTPSLGYNGSDLFSPEMTYGVSDQTRLASYLTTINRLLGNAQEKPVSIADIAPTPNQLKVLVDLCHLKGIAVVFDVVYNHAGGFDGDDESLFFWDRESGDNNSSLYFSNLGWAGGLSFALWKQEVRQFLIDNALFHQKEFHVDGLRYDEISALVQLNQGTGWKFCEDLTSTVRFSRNRSIQNAEFWPVDVNIVKPAAFGGAGFDVTQHDGLRLAVRQAISQASGGDSSFVSMDGVAASLSPAGFSQAWQVVPCVENHDVVFAGRDWRIPRLADSSNSRSFFARSRARVATGVLLLAPGIPQLFMGQEFLEDKQWSDNAGGPNRIYWRGVDSGDKSMVDFLRFTQDLIRIRREQPALRGGSISVFHVHNGNRVLAFHRWLQQDGRDLLIVVSLNDQVLYNYQIGFPFGGRWEELFNSDVYDQWVNPNVTGNGGQVYADDQPMHGFGYSSSLVLPANSILVFGR
jgi:1,4-alpha-glucan branching enzyme